MNKAVLIGNLVRDPEIRQTKTCVSTCTFTIAVNRLHTNGQGKREADYIPIVTWRGMAESCAKHLRQGNKVGIVGMIQTRSYDAQDGSKRYITEVIADEVDFLTPKAKAEDGMTEVTDDYDELPFG